MSRNGDDPPINPPIINEQDSDDEGTDYVPRTLREFNVPRAGDVRGAIRLPRVAGNQPNFNPGVVNIVQQNTFHGMDHEDPHAHVQTFLECCATIKIHGATNDYIRLALFPFTLRDKAKKWLGSLPRDSITTWRELSKLFLTRFFPHKRTAKVRTQLTSFKQRSDEMLNEAWERFRELQYSCPHHGIPDWLLIQSFYADLTDSSRTSVDAVAGGALLDRETADAINLIDSIATNQQWSGRESTRATGSGRFEVDQITALTAKLDAMQRAFDKMTVKSLGDQQPKSCVMCGDEGHVYEHCPLVQRDDGPEQVNSLNNEPSYFPKPPYNQSYSKDQAEQQAWRWKNNNPAPFNNHHSSSNNNNRNFYQNASFPISNNQASQSGPPKPYIAPAVSDFMHEQGKMNQMMFEQLEAINTQLAGLASQNRAKERMGYQTASNQQHPGRLPSQPEVNPR